MWEKRILRTFLVLFEVGRWGLFIGRREKEVFTGSWFV